jgi:transglutaminase-like putative cysteine protease
MTVSDARPLLWSCAAFTGGMLLHVDRVPWWASVAAFALVAWRLLTARSAWRVPPLFARAGLALLLVAVVFTRFHTLNGLAAGTTLLMLMAALKLLETRAPRDLLVMVAAALFLLLAACLDRQSLARAPLYLLQVWLCCTALAVVTARGLAARPALALAGRALLLATPLALLFFVSFPRLAGAFWAVPRGEEALTGLSDTMSPGGITHLTSSYETAFRARFASAAPPPPERYWRGPVLHEFDGYTWRRGATPAARQPLEAAGGVYRYNIALEPSRHRWWFALDTPAQSPDAKVQLTYDYQLLSAEPVTQAVSFEGLSYTHSRASGPLNLFERSQDLRLPRGRNPRARALAQQLRTQAGSDAAVVQAALEYLRRGGFEYSLDPQPTGSDSVDDLLFGTRAGFCGHYASAFVTLMRGAGVPARVVTGYLGGEWNPVGGYFVVRQSDAHAWAEVWLTDRGWTRVDPTAVVAPERLRRGIMDLFPGSMSAPARLWHGSVWLTRLMQGWDATNDWWNGHVVKFTLDSQLSLLARLGIRDPDTRYLGWVFVAGLMAWLAVIAWHIGRDLALPRRDALADAYLRLCRKLAAVAPARVPYQGPMNLAATVSERRPDLKERVEAVLTRYAQLRYGPPSPATRTQDLRAFQRAVTRLSLTEP